MYNRYVPGSNGVYQRHTVQEKPSPCDTPVPVQQSVQDCTPESPQRQQQPIVRQSGLFGLDWGDLLLFCIVLLLLLDSEEEDTLPILIMAAAFILLQ